MITNIDFSSRIGPELRQQHLKDYWNEYFLFRDDAPLLHEIIEAELVRELEAAEPQASPFIDSQQSISRILTNLGAKHTFHRQFSESFPELRKEQIMGMQLYRIIAEDDQYWVYSPTQHAGHLFPHATYFIPRENPAYVRLNGA